MDGFKQDLIAFEGLGGTGYTFIIPWVVVKDIREWPNFFLVKCEMAFFFSWIVISPLKPWTMIFQNNFPWNEKEVFYKTDKTVAGTTKAFISY